MKPLAASFEQRTGYLSQNFAPAGGLFAIPIFIPIKILEKRLDF